MKSLRHIFCFVLFFGLLLSALPALGQNSMKIYGRVVNEYDNPLELALVRVEGQLTAVSVCNGKGQYKLICQPGDSVVVVASMIGHRTRKHVLQGVMADSVALDFKLPSQSDVQLNEATVKAYRRQTEQTLRLAADKAKLMPSTTGNAVEELIQTQMGVSTHNEMSSQYNVRGGSFDENCVYLNGVEVYRPMLVSSGQQEGLSIINSHMVKDINFSAGGFPAQYGDKMSSVLDITYKRPEKAEGTVALSLLGAEGYVGLGGKTFSMMNGVRYKTMRHMLGSLQTTGEYDPRFVDYQNYTSWRPTEKWDVDLIGYVASNHYTFRPKDRETSFGTMESIRKVKIYFDGQEKDMFRTLFGSLSVTHHFTPKTSLQLLGAIYSTKEQETYDISGEYWLNEATSQEQLGVGTYMEHARNFLTARVASLRLRFSHQWARHRLLTGFSHEVQKIKENATEWEMRDSSDYSLPRVEDRLDLIYTLRAKTEMTAAKTAAFLQDTYRWNSTLGYFTLNAGVRLTHWDWNGETLLSPRVSLGLIPSNNQNWTLRAAVGVYYQTPFYKELRDTVTLSGATHVRLNKDIRSQRAVHFLLGGDYQFKSNGRPFRFTTEAYYKALSHLVPYNVNNLRVVYYGENLSHGHAAGIDFKLFGEFVPGTDSWATLSLMSIRETINGRSVSRPTDQRYNFTLFFTDYFPGTDRWKMTLKGAFAGGLPFGAPHRGIEHSHFRAPAYRRVDIGMSYRLLNNEKRTRRRGLSAQIKNAWLGVDVFNVFDLYNVSSYFWVTDVTNTQYAVPNYLTGRLLNARLLLEF